MFMGNKKERKEKKVQTADEIAQIMVENMKANMNNPDFFAEKEQRMQAARDKVLKKRKERNSHEE